MTHKDTSQSLAEALCRRRFRFKKLFDNVDVLKSDVEALKDELAYVIRDSEIRETLMKAELADLKQRVSGEAR